MGSPESGEDLASIRTRDGPAIRYYRTADEITFWSITGQKLATYNFTQSGSTASVTVASTRMYFGRKLIGGNVTPDRLGSIGKFYPWGQEKPSATQNGTEKFTGYFRDAETGLDYAMNRFHNPGTGRFMTPDPYMNSAGPTDPGSWNRYAYTRGDPVNRIDPNGTCDSGIADASCSDPLSNFCVWGFIEPGDNLSGCPGGGPSYWAGPFPQGGGGGGGANPPQSTAPPPDCDQILTNDISQYLSSYAGGTSPLDTTANIQQLVTAGMSDDVDPRFIVALSVAESSAGTHLTWGPYNAWNIKVRNPAYNGRGKQPAYTSWAQAINGVTGLIGGRQYFGSGLTTTSTIYPTYQGPGYELGLGNLNTALGQMFGNPNLLTDPCNPKNLRDPNQ